MTPFSHVLLAANTLVGPSTPPAVVGGVPTAPGEFESVVALHIDGGICSGTLITPTIVLTAAHCIDGARSIVLEAGPRASRTDVVPITRSGVHPDYCRTCSPTDIDVYDYAFVEIAAGSLGVTELAEPIIDQADWDTAIGPGGAVTIVGYGRDETGVTGQKRKVATWITRQTASGQEFTAGGDFRDACLGDSGGPAFVKLLDGRWRQAGIVSRGPDPCGAGGVYAAPYPALEWIQEQTGEALCGPECSDCDCIDTSADNDTGCGCRSDTPPSALMMLALLGFLRRRS